MVANCGWKVLYRLVSCKRFGWITRNGDFVDDRNLIKAIACSSMERCNCIVSTHFSIIFPPYEKHPWSMHHVFTLKLHCQLITYKFLWKLKFMTWKNRIKETSLPWYNLWFRTKVWSNLSQVLNIIILDLWKALEFRLL